MSSSTALDHLGVFEEAWSRPGNTAVELPPVDVNQVLAAHYDLDRELVLTREMLWDMEVRKAVDPDVYITSVVTPGSVRRWPSEPGDDFVRISEQRLWLDREQRGLVLEQVHLDHDRHAVLFIGAAELTSPDGETFRAGTGQPLFHVEHSVAGTEQRPVNRWRIVNLTQAPDLALLDHFAWFGARPGLRDFLEVYIRDNLGRRLTPKG
jgi:hypothetical protein